MKEAKDIRFHNPFLNPMVTELLEDPNFYQRVFSESILVGETLQVFRPANVVLVGPQGAGKSMILNLARYSVLARFISRKGDLPGHLQGIPPFLGISVNLTRIGFQVFGRRSASKVYAGAEDAQVDSICAADFLNHFLLNEYIRALHFILSDEGISFRGWLEINSTVQQDALAEKIASWDCWFGYYRKCSTLSDIQKHCSRRLLEWQMFLNWNSDELPHDIWETKTIPGVPLHSMGNLLIGLTPEKTRLPLFVVIDQYEELPALNERYGSELQRVINSFIKGRDPVVFYKIGARTHDWGHELRISGSESRIEIQRDYTTIDLMDVLMRTEDNASSSSTRSKRGWLFPHFAADVVKKRLKAGGISNTATLCQLSSYCMILVMKLSTGLMSGNSFAIICETKPSYLSQRRTFFLWTHDSASSTAVEALDTVCLIYLMF